MSIAESRTRKTIVNAAEIRRSQWAEGMGIAVASNTEIMHTLSRFGLKKFASATMYVLQTVFAMPDKYLICQPNEKEGKFLLGEIMMAGNFGKYDSRISHSTWQMGHAWEKLKHNYVFRTMVGHSHVESPNFAAINKGKGKWQEQSLT